MTRIFNRKSEQEKRRKLRKNATYPEKILWERLRKRRINGIRFLRQYSVGKFVLDFYSPKVKLAIEIDGSSHIGKEEYDAFRQKFIENLGIHFLRFGNQAVLNDTEFVVERIRDRVEELLREG